jgi:hypothetical protein
MDSRVSFLAQDPDERIVRWGWVFWIAWLAVGGALLLGDYRSGVVGLGAVLAAPFWALWLLWLVYRIARAGVRSLRRLNVHDGLHYEFDGHPIHIEFDGDAIRFEATAVFEALGTDRDARNPERVRQIAGRDGLAPSPISGQLCFTEKGLAAWLDRRTGRAATQFTRWVELQVIAPYRRRRELQGAAEDGH